MLSRRTRTRVRPSCSHSRAALARCARGACGRGGGGDLTVPVGAPTYDVAAPAWAVGRSLHVGDVELDVRPAPEAFGGDDRRGVYYLARGTLWFTDGADPVAVAEVDTDRLALSTDGRHLGLLDRVHGPTDAAGVAAAVAVVLDVTTGKEVLRTRPARPTVDVAALYAAQPPTFVGFDEDAAYVADPLVEGVTRLPLDGGPGGPAPDDLRVDRSLGSEVDVVRTTAGHLRLARDGERPDARALLSPAGDLIHPLGAATPPPGPTTPPPGVPVRFDPGERWFQLGGWIDQDTYYGAASADGSSAGPSGRTVVVACDVRAPRCRPVSAEFQLPTGPELVFGTGSPATAR